MTSEMKDFIVRLLDKNPRKRLGHRGKKEVINHPWFNDIDWKKLYRKEIKSPFKPEIKEKKFQDHILTGISTSLGFNKRRKDGEGDISETVLVQSKVNLVKQNSHKFNDF